MVTIKCGDNIVRAHLANSGRLHELLVPGNRVMLTPVQNPDRSTQFNLTLVYYNSLWVCVDTRFPNRLFGEGIHHGIWHEFADLDEIVSEIKVENHRLDFLLRNQDNACYVECKSVTLVQDGCARFPDAPTLRGRQHLELLMRLKAQGYRAAVVFMVLRSDAEVFHPNQLTDSEFAHVLKKAKQSGVEVYVFSYQVTPDCLEFCRRLSIDF